MSLLDRIKIGTGIILLNVAVCFSPSLFAQNVTINPTGSPGSSSAMLDVNADNKGMLIPRVALTSATDNTTIPAPVTSLLVYNTATAGAYPDNVLPGFYYWNATKWISIYAPQVGLLAYAEFYATMPPNNLFTIPPGSAIEFPNAGPSSDPAITMISPDSYELAAIGTYMVSWQASINEPAQLGIELNGAIIPHTIVGRGTGTSQIVGNSLISTSSIFSVLRVINPFGNSLSYTLTPNAGGSNPVSASLIITRIR